LKCSQIIIIVAARYIISQGIYYTRGYKKKDVPI